MTCLSNFHKPKVSPSISLLLFPYKLSSLLVELEFLRASFWEKKKIKKEGIDIIIFLDCIWLKKLDFRKELI